MEKQLVKFDRDHNGNLTYEHFECNGKKFRFIKPGEPVGIVKWTEAEKLKIVVGNGLTFEELIVGMRDLRAQLSAERSFAEIRSDAILWTASIEKSAVEMSKSRYDKAFYLATIFIYREGEDPYKWSPEIAESMIEDWISGGLNEQDVFFFVMSLIPAWSAIFQELSEKAKAGASAWLVGMLLKKAKGETIE